MVLWGLAAGGSAGNASPVAPPLPATARDAGRDDGGVGRAEEGADSGADGATQGVVVTRGVGVRLELAGGRPGNAEAEEVVEEEVALPQDPSRDTEDREDCAVEDLSLSTRDVLFGGAEVEVDGVDEVTVAQPAGKELPVIPLGPGRDG
jgi:hypothetical protein